MFVFCFFASSQVIVRVYMQIYYVKSPSMLASFRLLWNNYKLRLMEWLYLLRMPYNARMTEVYVGNNIFIYNEQNTNIVNDNVAVEHWPVQQHPICLCNGALAWTDACNAPTNSSMIAYELR